MQKYNKVQKLECTCTDIPSNFTAYKAKFHLQIHSKFLAWTNIFVFFHKILCLLVNSSHLKKKFFLISCIIPNRRGQRERQTRVLKMSRVQGIIIIYSLYTTKILKNKNIFRKKKHRKREIMLLSLFVFFHLFSNKQP